MEGGTNGYVIHEPKPVKGTELEICGVRAALKVVVGASDVDASDSCSAVFCSYVAEKGSCL